MAGPYASKGTVLQLSISAVFTTIARLTRLRGPGMRPQTYDALTLDGAAGIPVKPTGYIRGGTVSASILFDPLGTTDQALTDLITAPAVASWKNVYNDGSSTAWPYSGTLTQFEPAADPAGPLTADIEITLDGIPTLPT